MLVVKKRYSIFDSKRSAVREDLSTSWSSSSRKFILLLCRWLWPYCCVLPFTHSPSPLCSSGVSGITIARTLKRWFSSLTVPTRSEWAKRRRNSIALSRKTPSPMSSYWSLPTSRFVPFPEEFQIFLLLFKIVYNCFLLRRISLALSRRRKFNSDSSSTR